MTENHPAIFIQFPRPRLRSFSEDSSWAHKTEVQRSVDLAKRTIVIAQEVVRRVKAETEAVRSLEAHRSADMEKAAAEVRNALKEARTAVLEAKLAILHARESGTLTAEDNWAVSSLWTTEPLIPAFGEEPGIPTMEADVVTIASPYVEPPVPVTGIPATFAEPALPRDEREYLQSTPRAKEYLQLESDDSLVIPNVPSPDVVTLQPVWEEKEEERSPKVYVPSTNRLPRNVLVTYICKELLLYFAMAFVFFFLVFFVNQILLMAQDILKYQVPIQDVARLIFFSLPFTIAQSAPMATIVGFLMCLGRMMTDNEVLIFRASGRSYALLLVIVLSLGMGITTASFMVNDYLLPAGISSYNQLYRLVSVANPAVVLKSDSVTKTNDLTVVVGHVDKQSVSDLVFFDTDRNRNQRIIVARNATVGTPSDRSVLMQLNMSDVTLVSLNPQRKGDYDVITSEEVSMNLFASTIFKPTANRNPNEYPYLELRKQLQELRSDPDTSANTLNSYSLELSKKFSMPFGALFFAFLALPLAIIFGKHNGQTIGLIIGLFLSFLYWAMIIVGQRLAIRNGMNGTVMMWLPDVLIGFFALVFFAGLRRR